MAKRKKTYTDQDKATTSTPAPSRFPKQLPPEVSDISSSDQGNKFM